MLAQPHHLAYPSTMPPHHYQHQHHHHQPSSSSSSSPYIAGPHSTSSAGYYPISPAAPMIPSTPSFAPGPSSGFTPTTFYPSAHSPLVGYEASSPTFPTHQQQYSKMATPSYGLPVDMRAMPHAGEYTSFAPTTSPSGSRRAELPIGRRQRVTMACTYCRRRKIRCDGGSPCTNCTRGHRCCDYTPISATESSQASRARKMAQVLKDSMPEPSVMIRPVTASSSGHSEPARPEGDFAFGMDESARHRSSRPVLNHARSVPAVSINVPSVLKSDNRGPTTSHSQSHPMSAGSSSVPLVYESHRSSSSESLDYVSSVQYQRPKIHHSRSGFAAVGPVSPPYTPSEKGHSAPYGPSMIDISATPDLITPVHGYHQFDPHHQVSGHYNPVYPTRSESTGHKTSHSVHGLLSPNTYIHGNGHRGAPSMSAPVSPVNPGGIRRHFGGHQQMYPGPHAPSSTYLAQPAGAGLVGLGIVMPNGEADLFNGLRA